MKTAFFLFALLASAAADAGTASMQGIRLNIPNLILFTSDDIARIESALAAKEEKSLEISEGRSANCKAGTCKLEGRGYHYSFDRSDFERFSSGLKKARREGKEVVAKQGEITTRCSSERCALDLSFEDTKERTVKAKPKNSFTGDLIVAIIEGMLKGMVQ